MTKFTSASEVRSFLKEKGFLKVRVRWGDNPFGGEGFFFVKPLDVPTPALYSGGSQEPSQYHDPRAQVVERYAKLQEALKGTNARVTS